MSKFRHLPFVETTALKEAARCKDVLAEVIPALERAARLKANQFPVPCKSQYTQDEWSALWLARAILETRKKETRNKERKCKAF